jgi:hypothetical protein
MGNNYIMNNPTGILILLENEIITQVKSTIGVFYHIEFLFLQKKCLGIKEKTETLHKI